MKVLIFILAFVAGSIVYGYYMFEPSRINAWETRYYLIVALLLVCVLAFALLRLYNAVVINSKYLNTLNTSIKGSLVPKLNKVATSLDKPYQQLGGVIAKLRGTIESLIKILIRGKNVD